MADRLTTAQAATVAAWVDHQAAGRARILDGVLRFVLAVIRSMGGGAMYNQDLVDEQAVKIAAQVRSGQVTMANLTTAYLDQVLRALDVEPPRDPVHLPTQLRPVDPVVQWRRPAEQYRYERSQGQAEENALAAAVRRAEELADADIALADREATARHLSVVPQVVGMRRVIRPERSDSGTCGLCLAASDRVYRVDSLLPVHLRCKCEALPILAGRPDPGRSLNEDELNALYAAAGSTSQSDLARVRYRVDEHGELGPTLMPADATDRLNAKRAPTRPGPREGYAGEIAALEETLADLERRASTGELVDGPLAYQRERLAHLRAIAEQAA
ncbi:hypothetical protein [Thalassiella azotivora]